MLPNRTAPEMGIAEKRLPRKFCKEKGGHFATNHFATQCEGSTRERSRRNLSSPGARLWWFFFRFNDGGWFVFPCLDGPLLLAHVCVQGKNNSEGYAESTRYAGDIWLVLPHYHDKQPPSRAWITRGSAQLWRELCKLRRNVPAIIVWFTTFRIFEQFS